jgi:hypothetical protein
MLALARLPQLFRAVEIDGPGSFYTREGHWNFMGPKISMASSAQGGPYLW